jgi:hypothetical protein
LFHGVGVELTGKFAPVQVINAYGEVELQLHSVSSLYLTNTGFYSSGIIFSL